MDTAIKAVGDVFNNIQNTIGGVCEKIIPDPVKNILMPKPVTDWTVEKIVDARKKEFVAKIIGIASYIFATIAIVATVVAIDATVVCLPAVLGFGIAALALGILCWKMEKSKKTFFEGLDDAKKSKLAQDHLYNLFYKTPVKNFKDAEDIKKCITEINTIFEFEAIDSNYLEQFNKLNDLNTDQTLIATIMKYNETIKDPNDLFNFKLDVVKTEYMDKFFGPSKLEKHLTIKWNKIGNPAEPDNSGSDLHISYVSGAKCAKEFHNILWKDKDNESI